MRLALTVLLLTAPPLVGHVANAPDLGTAEAKFIKKFKGKTKFDRKMNETFTDDARLGGDPGATVTTTAAFVDQPYEVPPATSDTGHDARVIHKTLGVHEAGPYFVTVDYDGVPMTFAFEADTVWGAGDTAVQTGELGVRVRLRGTENGLKVVVRNDDSLWNPYALGAVGLSDSVGELELDDGVIRQTLMSDFDVSGLPPLEDLEGARYEATLELRAEDGTLLQVRRDLDAIGEDGIDTGFEKVRVSETRRGDVKVVAFARGDAASVEATVTDADGGVLLDGVFTEPSGRELWFVHQTLTFEDPSSATDQPYGAVVTFFGPDSPLGASDYEIVVEGLEVVDATQPPPPTTVIGPDDAPMLLSLRQLDATNFELFVGTTNPEVTWVDVQLTDLIGNAAIPEAVAMEPHTAWTKWVLKGNAGTGTLGEGGLGDLDLRMFDEAGELRGVAGGSLEGAEELMFGFGKGTRESASQASAKPELL